MSLLETPRDISVPASLSPSNFSSVLEPREIVQDQKDESYEIRIELGLTYLKQVLLPKIEILLLFRCHENSNELSTTSINYKATEGMRKLCRLQKALLKGIDILHADSDIHERY